jgi:hypothetical protein
MASTKARRALRARRRGRAPGPAARMEAKTPTGVRVRREGRDRPDGRQCWSSGVPRSWGRRHGVCRRTRRAGLARTGRSVHAQSRGRKRHSEDRAKLLLRVVRQTGLVGIAGVREKRVQVPAHDAVGYRLGRAARPVGGCKDGHDSHALVAACQKRRACGCAQLRDARDVRASPEGGRGQA